MKFSVVVKEFETSGQKICRTWTGDYSFGCLHLSSNKVDSLKSITTLQYSE